MTADTLLARQVEELQLIQSCLVADEFQWRGTQDEVAAWSEVVSQSSSDQSDHTPFSFCIRLASEQHGPSLWLNIDLPRNPDGESQIDIVVRDGSAARQGDLTAIRAKADQRMTESKEEGVDHRIFDLYTFLHEALDDVPIALMPLTSSGADSNATISRSSQVSPSSAHRIHKSAQPNKYKINRTILWSHHLIAPSKRRDLTAWCAELSVWGLVKLGYPGYLCFEGIQSDVDEIVRRVKALQWHALKLKDENVRDLEESIDSRDAALLKCNLSYGHSAREAAQKAAQTGHKLRTTCDEVESMKDIVERLHTARLDEEEVAEVLGLRTKATGHH